MFNDTSGALPFVSEGKELPRWPWSWKERAPPVAGDGGGGAAAAAADEDLHLDAGLLATLQVEWSRFKAFTANSIISEPCTYGGGQEAARALLNPHAAILAGPVRAHAAVAQDAHLEYSIDCVRRAASRS